VNAALITHSLNPGCILPQAAYVIIEPHEALTVIDLNSTVLFTRSANAREKPCSDQLRSGR